MFSCSDVSLVIRFGSLYSECCVTCRLHDYEKKKLLHNINKASKHSDMAVQVYCSAKLLHSRASRPSDVEVQVDCSASLGSLIVVCV